MASSPVPLVLSCSVCQMLCYSLTSFSNNNTCDKYNLFAALQARITDLESWLHSLEIPVAHQAPVVCAVEGSIATIRSPTAG